MIDSIVSFIPPPEPPKFPAAPPQVLDLETVIHSYIHYVLQLNHGNKKKTARQLGISRSTLYRLLKNDPPVSF